MPTSSLQEQIYDLSVYTKNEIDRLQQEKELTDELLFDLCELLAKSKALPLSELEAIFQNRLTSLAENIHHNPNAFSNATRQIHRLRMAVACGLAENNPNLIEYRNQTFKEFDHFLRTR